MKNNPSPSEYLVISRGQWDKDIPQETIQRAIDAFYVWHDRLVAEGRVLKDRRSVSFVEAEARNPDGTIVAKAIGTVRVRHAR